MPRYEPDQDEKLRRIINDEYHRRNLHIGCFGLLLRSFIPLSVIFFIFWLAFVPKQHRVYSPNPDMININTEEGRQKIRKSAEEYRRNHPNPPAPLPTQSP